MRGGPRGLRTVLRGISLVWERRTSVLIGMLVRERLPDGVSGEGSLGASGLIGWARLTRRTKRGAAAASRINGHCRSTSHQSRHSRGGARKQRGKEKSKERGADNGVSTAETSSETVQNLENLCLDIDQEDRYVVAQALATPHPLLLHPSGVAC